jgi:hypothetical protein
MKPLETMEYKAPWIKTNYVVQCLYKDYHFELHYRDVKIFEGTKSGLVEAEKCIAELVAGGNNQEWFRILIRKIEDTIWLDYKYLPKELTHEN